MKKWTPRKKIKKRQVSFNPNRKFVESAIDEYLRKGGKITRVIVDEESYRDFVSLREIPLAVDDFLNETR